MCYDLAGNLTTKIEDLGGTGRTTTYTYDGLDRLTLVDFETDPSWVLSYDTSAALNQKGRLASASNGVVTTELEYTPQGQLAVERTLIGGGSYPVAYSYDAAGNLATLTTPSGVTTAYAYSGSRPKEVTVTAGSESQMIREIEYLPFGPRTRADFPPEDGVTGDNTVLSTRQYNLRYQVTEIDVTTPAETVLDLSFTYDYTAGAPGPDDPGPNLDRVVDHRDASESRFYFYDELDRLWKATDLSGNPIYTYLYDANGNRTQQVSPSGTTSYGYATGTDLLTQATGAEAKHYASDAYGSRIWAGASAYAGTPSLVHDEANRLVEVRDPSTLAVLGEYTYDAFGRRVRKVAGGVTELFFYGPGAHLVEEQVPAGSPATARAYVHLEDEPVGVVDRAAGGAPSFAWLHGDALTSPRAVTSAPASGGAAVVWRATYAPFGLAEPDEDPDGDLQAFTLDLRFPGQHFDAESGAHDNWHRTFDPSTGRYLEADPIGQRSDLNVHVYAKNSPLNFYDPWGLASRPRHTLGTSPSTAYGVVASQQLGPPVPPSSGECSPAASSATGCACGAQKEFDVGAFWNCMALANGILALLPPAGCALGIPACAKVRDPFVCIVGLGCCAAEGLIVNICIQNSLRCPEDVGTTPELP